MHNAPRNPMLRGVLHIGDLLRQAGKVWLYTLVLAVVALLLSNVLIIENLVLRIAFNGILLGAVALLLYADGGARGEREVAFGESLARRAQGSQYTPEAQDLRKCYLPLRGLLAALLAALPLLALGLVLAAIARPYAYSLQDLPSWLSFYRRRVDIGAPLTYYTQTISMGAEDYLRLVVRLCSLPLAYVLGGIGDAGALAADRWSWLFALVLPCAQGIGYLRGPSLHATVLKRNEEAKRKHAKKLARKKKQAKRNAGANKKGPEQLI